VSILQVTDIKKSYGGIRALTGCTMTFEEGAINGLIGPNGSGKTTLFNVISGYEVADAGQVTLRGQDITNAKPDQVFQAGIGRLTVLENLHVASQRRGFMGQLRSWKSAAERQHAMEVLDFVGLTPLADEPAGGLSYGQQKLLEFAFIMIARPAIILLDEPAGGVNPTLLRGLADRIRALNKEGVTFVIVEHDMEFVMGLCDRVMVMHQGCALTAGAPQEVRSDPAVLEAYLGTDMTDTEGAA
jgi:ABC-type branched-subunit amino acid transport system ATPase component